MCAVAFFFFNDTATTEIYTLSLHDALPILVRLTTVPRLAFSGQPSDFFTPSNFVALNQTDTDLGSTAPLVLPAQPDSSTPDLVFIAGKQGVGYLINRTSMDGLNGGGPAANQCVD